MQSRLTSTKPHPPTCRRAQNNAELSIRGIAEFGLIAGLLVIWEWSLPGSTNLSSMSPQPYWIPVILLSAQYGTASGLAAAAATFGLSVILGLPQPVSTENYYAYLLRIFSEPVLWIGAAIVLGEMRSRELRRYEGLKLAIAEASQQRSAISKYCKVLMRHTRNLERQLATTEQNSIRLGLSHLAELRQSDLGQLRPALERVVKSLIGAARFSVYLHHGERLMRVPEFSSVCAETTDNGKQGYRNAGSLVPRAVLRKHRSLSILCKGDLPLLEGLGVFACPLTKSENRTVIGLLVFETVDVDRLSAETEAAIRAIAVELSYALAANQYEVPEISSLMQPASGTEICRHP